MKVMNVWMLKQLVLIFIILYTHTYINTHISCDWMANNGNVYQRFLHIPLTVENLLKLIW